MKKKSKQKSAHRDRGIVLIAILRLLKAVLVLGIAIGALSLLHKNVAAALMRLLETLHVDHDNKYIHGLVMKLGFLSNGQLEAISAGSFFYAALSGTEGVGLLLRKHWAEYLTIIATSLFIPLEIYELVEHFGIGKVIVLIVNLAIVAYLIYRVKHDPIHMESHKPRSKARG